jgi:hypothetical protein
MLALVLGAATVILLVAIVSFGYGSMIFTAGRTNYINSFALAETALNRTLLNLRNNPGILEEPIDANFPYEGSKLIQWLKDEAPGYVEGDMKMILQNPNYAIGVGTDQEYTRCVRVQYGTGTMPDAPAAMYMDGEDIAPGLSGAAFTVDGYDHRSLSTTRDGPGDPVAGMAVTNADTYDDWIDFFQSSPSMKNKGKKIQGEGDFTPNIVNTGEVIDIPTVADQYAEMATRIIDGETHITDSTDPYDGDEYWGVPDEPEVVLVENDVIINGNFSGCGVLVIEGNLEVKGNFTWQGLVIVMGDFTVGIGSAEIWGAMLINKDTATLTVDIGGSFDMRYSTEALGFLGDQFYILRDTWEEL